MDAAGQTRLPDIEAIRGLITGCIHRDRGNWADLLELFHPDGTIEVTWFAGLARDFVEGSRRMGESALRTKHLIANPFITFADDRAVAETNAMIVVENTDLDLGASTHNRFIDKVERRGGVWRIVHRASVYDFSTFASPYGPVDRHRTGARFPTEVCGAGVSVGAKWVYRRPRFRYPGQRLGTLDPRRCGPMARPSITVSTSPRATAV